MDIDRRMAMAASLGAALLPGAAIAQDMTDLTDPATYASISPI
jgi:hypothetical protein